MERLQEALSRARSRREETAAGRIVPSGDADTDRSLPRPRGDDRARAQAWQQLAQFEPNERLLKANRVVSFFGGREAQGFDMMRTKVIQQAKAKGWRRILVTSPSPRCGKTTLTANLAFSLARHTDLRALVIEIDMRRPELAHLLGMRDNLAFARVLSGDEPAETHLRAFGSNLAFGTNRVAAANPSELLHSSVARETLTAIEERYAPDLMLFDAPPVLASDDTVGFLDSVDAAIIVAAAEQTSISEIDVAEAEIAASTNVLGVVLNKTRYGGDAYGYYDGSYY